MVDPVSPIPPPTPVTYSAFNPASCFQQVAENTPNDPYTNGYCIGNILILLMATVSLVACTALLVWHIKAHQRLSLKKETTWILVFLVFYEILLFAKYCFNLYSWNGYSLMVILMQFLESMVIFLVCAIFAKRAATNTLKLQWVT